MPNAAQSTGDFKGDRLTLKMFGALGNGTTDDTTAITDAIGTLGTYGGRLHIPKGIYPVSSTITINSLVGIKLFGQGASSVFKWTGNATTPMFIIEDCLQPTFEDFEIRALDPTKPLLEGIRIIHQSLTAPPAPSQSLFHNIRQNGQISGAVISNVTHSGGIVTVATSTPHGFTTGGNVTILQVNGITNTNGTWDPCTVTGANTFTVNVAVTPTGAYSGSISPGLCYQNNIGLCYRITEIGAGGDIDNDFHYFYRCWAQGFKTAMWSIEAGNSHANVMNQCLAYGGQYAVTTHLNSPRVGNFKWYGGFAAVSDEVFNLGDNASVGPIIIDGLQSEDCQRLMTVNPTNEGQGLLNYTHAIEISSIRFQPQGLHPDGGVIVYNASGPLSIKNSTFGLPFTTYYGIPINFQYNPAAAEVYSARAFTFENNVVIGANSTDAAIFPGTPPTFVNNSTWRIGDGPNQTGHIGGGPVTVTGIEPLSQITAHGLSGAGRIAGINLRIDSTDLWQMITDNAASNDWFLQFNNSTRFIKVDTSGNVIILTGQFFNGGETVSVNPGTGLGILLNDESLHTVVASLTIPSAGVANLTIGAVQITGVGTGFPIVVSSGGILTQSLQCNSLNLSQLVRSNGSGQLINGTVNLATSNDVGSSVLALVNGGTGVTSLAALQALVAGGSLPFPLSVGGTGVTSLGALATEVLVTSGGGASGNFQAFQSTTTASITFVSGGITAPSGGGLCSWSSGSGTFVTGVTTITVSFAQGLIV